MTTENRNPQMRDKQKRIEQLHVLFKGLRDRNIIEVKKQELAGYLFEQGIGVSLLEKYLDEFSKAGYIEIDNTGRTILLKKRIDTAFNELADEINREG